MVQVSRTFTVRQEQEKVVAYLRDFANATQWDPGSVSNVQISDGPVGVGTVWHNTSSLAGAKPELDYTLVALEQKEEAGPHRVNIPGVAIVVRSSNCGIEEEGHDKWREDQRVRRAHHEGLKETREYWSQPLG